MKKITSSRIVALILLTFGITYLNFDDLSFVRNIRPYIMLAVGLLILLYSFINKKR